eukprot:14721-Heterococcus_DN1.PRE.1
MLCDPAATAVAVITQLQHAIVLSDSAIRALAYFYDCTLQCYPYDTLTAYCASMLRAALDAAYTPLPRKNEAADALAPAPLLVTSTLPLPPDFSIAGSWYLNAKATLLMLVASILSRNSSVI